MNAHSEIVQEWVRLLRFSVFVSFDNLVHCCFRSHTTCWRYSSCISHTVKLFFFLSFQVLARNVLLVTFLFVFLFVYNVRQLRMPIYARRGTVPSVMSQPFRTLHVRFHLWYISYGMWRLLQHLSRAMHHPGRLRSKRKETNPNLNLNLNLQKVDFDWCTFFLIGFCKTETTVGCAIEILTDEDQKLLLIRGFANALGLLLPKRLVVTLMPSSLRFCSSSRPVVLPTASWIGIYSNSAGRNYFASWWIGDSLSCFRRWFV